LEALVRWDQRRPSLRLTLLIYPKIHGSGDGW
jgi:hypothetical protein